MWLGGVTDVLPEVDTQPLVGKTIDELLLEVRREKEQAALDRDLMKFKKFELLENDLHNRLLTYEGAPEFTMKDPKTDTLLRKGEPDVTIAEVPDRVDVTEIIQKKGKAEPFGTEESAKSAMRKRKLDPRDYEVIPHNDGFVIAKRKGLMAGEEVDRLVLDDMIQTVSEGDAGNTVDISQGLTQVTGKFTSNPTWYGKALTELEKFFKPKQEKKYR